MTMKIVLASRNKNKIAELNSLLAKLGDGIEVLSLDDIGYTGDIVEDGASFAENAVIKASVPASMGYIGVADDSGLCVDALDGAPGIFSARYSAEGTAEANNKKLLRELSGVGAEDRGAGFVCTIACVVPDELELSGNYEEELRELATERAGRAANAFTVEAQVRGEILDAPRGEGGFGYDPLFYLPEKGKTFAELTDEEKNEVSHRGIAMGAFVYSLSHII